MPYRMETKGLIHIVLDGPEDKNEIARDKKYRILGYIGIGLAVIGVLLQIPAALHA